MAETVDLLVVGGGVNGAGVARDAAGRGLSVILAEKDDLAEGTSSRSGKYIHGGLRYLEYYEFRLVREALIEREVLLEAAPHITWPLRLILPHSPEQRPRWLIRLGLFLYDHLGGRRRIPATKAVDLRRDPEGAPVADAFPRGFAYYDCWVDDARLVVLNAVDAARRGADVLTRTEVASARREGELWRVMLRGPDGERAVTARAIFNAAGPWVEQVLGNVAGVNAQRRVRLVKGSHIVTRKWWDGPHGYVLQNDDRRLIFVNPYFDDMALIGTTDIPFEGRAEDVTPAEDEVAYLCRALNRYFRHQLSPADVLSSYAGVRPLFDDDSAKGASAVTRDYVFEVDGGPGRAPIVSAFGGKITTYRKLAEHGLDALKPFMPALRGGWTAGAPLPGGRMPGADFEGWFAAFHAARPWLPASLARHLARAYGADAETLLEGARGLGDLGRRFGPDFYEREARWAVEREFATRPDDVIRRRTKHALFMSEAEIAAFRDWFAGVRIAA